MDSPSLPAVDRGAVRILANTVAQSAAEKYPGKPLLTPKQVADVLWSRTDRSTVNGIRDRLVAGTLIPGLEKKGGRWEVPTADLVRVYDELVDQTRSTRLAKVVLPAVATPARGTARKRPWRAPIGHRPGVYGFQVADFFGEVYKTLDDYLLQEDAEWLARLGVLHMATSATDAWDRGYQQAVSSLHDEARAQDNDERKRLKQERERLEHAGDYQGVRAALDAAPDSFFMSRPTVQFYLSMSPGSFKLALGRGPHPFGEQKAGATKGEVDAWFQGLMKAKHAHVIEEVRMLRVSRDLDSGRPYLVDIDGTILADGAISNIDPRDVAHAASRGAGIRILTLTTALARPWRDATERAAWAAWRQWLLQRAIDDADEAMREARAQDLAATFPEKPPGNRRGI